MSYVVQPQSVSPPTLGCSPPLSPVLPPAPAMSPLQVETVSGLSTGHRSPLSPRDLPVVKSTSTLSVRLHARERSITDDALPVPRCPELHNNLPPGLYPRHCRDWNNPAGKCRRTGLTWSTSPYTTCADDYTIPSLRSVEVPIVRPADPNH